MITSSSYIIISTNQQLLSSEISTKIHLAKLSGYTGRINFVIHSVIITSKNLIIHKFKFQILLNGIHIIISPQLLW